MNFFIRLIQTSILGIIFSVNLVLAINQEPDLKNSITTNQNSVKVSIPGTIKDEKINQKDANPVNLGGTVKSIDVQKLGNITRLTFNVSQSFQTDIKILNFPFRMMFDIPNPYSWDIDDLKLPEKIKGNLVKNIRHGSIDSDSLRVILDLSSPVMIRKVFLYKLENNSYDFVVDLQESNSVSYALNSSVLVSSNDPNYYKNFYNETEDSEKKAREESKNNLIKNKISSYLSKSDYPIPLKQDSDNSRVVVVIDAGHGGKDVGAIASSSNIFEKDLVLSVSKLIKEELSKNQEISVILTRSADYYVPLQDRSLWANYFSADLFISIHADKSSDEKSSGLSIYTLSEQASDAQTQLLATQENNSDATAGIDLEQDNEDVKRILINLSQRMKINDSIFLANTLLDEVSKYIPVLANPVRSAGFIVLKSSDIPSVLIELGFLSNKEDTERLLISEEQLKIAKSISKGIQNYLWEKKKLTQKP
jgi:N-acetylmuramoyl-L-alanine amidase